MACGDVEKTLKEENDSEARGYTPGRQLVDLLNALFKRHTVSGTMRLTGLTKFESFVASVTPAHVSNSCFQ